MYLDLRSRFLKVTHPADMSFWWRLRLAIACWIYPPFVSKRDEWIKQYFNHEYMLSVHQFYENEKRALNKSLLRKDRKLKELQQQLKEKENVPQRSD